METLYCWRCKQEVPMMNEIEYQIAQGMYRRALFGTLKHPKGQFYELTSFYFKQSGTFEPDHNKIIHHRRTNYGPKCLDCGKPHRNHESQDCPECGSFRKEFLLHQA